MFFVENVFTNGRVRVISRSYKTQDGIWCKCALGSSQIQVRMTKAEDKIKNLYYDMPQICFYFWKKKPLEEEFEKKSSPPDERYGHKEDQQLSDLESPPKHK